MMIIILHSENSPLSREYLEKYKTNTIVLDWYNDNVESYRLAHNPEPSAFPSVCVDGKLWRVSDISQSPDWIRDEFAGKHMTEQEKIDAMSVVDALSILLACEALGIADKLQAILDNGFEKYWIASGGKIDLNNELTKQALSAGTIDVDAVKRKILEMRD